MSIIQLHYTNDDVFYFVQYAIIIIMQFLSAYWKIFIPKVTPSC